jgi:hypothetical protein
MRPFRKYCVLGALAAALAALGALTGNSQEREKGKSFYLDPRGEPQGFKPRLSMRYAVWHSPRGWHLRTTTAQKARRFKGEIRVEGGTFESVSAVGLEGKGGGGDRWKLNARRDQIDFNFTTERALDGLDFRVSKDARRLRFELFADGKRQSELVYIGQRGQHPQNVPFTLFAHYQPGRPAGFGHGEPLSYGIWHTGNVWHLRTSTARKSHRFKGSVTAEGGTFDGIDSFRLEGKGKVEDHWRLSANRRELHFDFKTAREVDGIDLRVSNSVKRLRFDLHIDGKHRPERVFLGPSGTHPDRIPFTLTTSGKKK